MNGEFFCIATLIGGQTGHATISTESAFTRSPEISTDSNGSGIASPFLRGSK